ncbi:MAG: YraN family protein [Rhodothermales bacterium]|nr:YraN family protein [Rhodothermales bacterium]MBO6781276.1 YraN family protein [Rhodothermales bacterium]
MSKTNHVETGRQGEAIAEEYLQGKGYQIMATNYRFERSEVDIVAFQPRERWEDGGDMVFVEVKTRRGTGFGHPEEAVTPEKRKHLIRAARAWLHENRMDRTPARFDVVAITWLPGQEPEIHHIENAFWTF